MGKIKGTGRREGSRLGAGRSVDEGQVLGGRWLVQVPSGEVSAAPHACTKVPGPKYLARGTRLFPPAGQHGSNRVPEPRGGLLLHQTSTMCTAGLHHSILMIPLLGSPERLSRPRPPSHAPVTWAAATALGAARELQIWSSAWATRCIYRTHIVELWQPGDDGAIAAVDLSEPRGGGTRSTPRQSAPS